MRRSYEAVMKAFDDLDGAKDGELEDPSACHSDPKTLQCGGGDDGKCLTAAQVEFGQMLYVGPTNPRTGEKIFEGAARRTEGKFGGYSVGNATGVATALYKYMIFQNPNWDWKTLDMDKDIAYGRAALRTINEADNANLKPFFDRGGKVLWYHDWNDGASPMQSAKYMNAVKQAVGVAETERSFRLFAMPGLGWSWQPPYTFAPS